MSAVDSFILKRNSAQGTNDAPLDHRHVAIVRRDTTCTNASPGQGCLAEPADPAAGHGVPYLTRRVCALT